MIEQLRNPDGLNVVEQAVLQRVLVQAGIDDVCDAGLSISETMPGAPRSGEQGRSTPDTGNPIRQADDSSDSTENNRDDARARANTSPPREGARLPADEHRRRCSFWALNNLQPVVYSEFAQAEPWHHGRPGQNPLALDIKQRRPSRLLLCRSGCRRPQPHYCFPVTQGYTAAITGPNH